VWERETKRGRERAERETKRGVKKERERKGGGRGKGCI
jgi:hypothetical protein